MKNANLLTGVNTNITYTVPIFLFHLPDVCAFQYNFDQVVRLPMIKVSKNRRVEERPPGFTTMQEIIHKRIGPEMIEENALTLLIEKTGGVLRQVFEVMQAMSNISRVSPPFTEEHVRYALNKLRNEFWGMVEFTV